MYPQDLESAYNYGNKTLLTLMFPVRLWLMTYRGFMNTDTYRKGQGDKKVFLELFERILTSKSHKKSEIVQQHLCSFTDLFNLI